MSNLAYADVELSLDQIRLSRRKRRVAVVTVYGDESSDETHKRVYAVAGLFGSQEQWDALELRWLARTGGKVFHGAECESDTGEYAGIDHKLNQKLYADLAGLLADSNLMGFGVAVDLMAYFDLFPSCLPEQPYFLGFRDVVINFAELAHLSIPSERVKFTFDRKTEIEFNAAYFYDQLMRIPQFEFRSYLEDEVAFASRKSVGIQAADLLARESMKALDNRIGPVRRIPRLSKQALDKTERFSFRTYERTTLVSSAVGAAQNIPDTIMPAYKAWLQREGLVDNISNRFRYSEMVRDSKGTKY
jgi:hypothetical protein